MADNGKLYIIITDQPVVNSTQTTITQTSQTITTQTKAPASGGSSPNSGIGVGQFAAYQFYEFIKKTCYEVVNQSINNIGNFTGNYGAQAEVTKAVSLLSEISGIGSAVIAGASVGGVYGALIAGTIAVASKAISIALEEKANAFQVQKRNYEVQHLRELAGTNPLTNGSRI